MTQLKGKWWVGDTSFQIHRRDGGAAIYIYNKTTGRTVGANGSVDDLKLILAEMLRKLQDG